MTRIMNKDTGGGIIIPPYGQRYTERFLDALAPCALFFFIYLFFGPLELIETNANLLGFDALKALPWYALAFVTLTLVSSAGIALLRGQLSLDAVKLLFALAVMSYVQCNFLNPDFGRQDGHQIEWTNYPRSVLLNLLLWLLVIAVVWALAALLKRRWAKIMTLASILLILMQAVGLGYLIVGRYQTNREAGVLYYLSTDEQLCVSKNNNILVFYLDAFSNSSMQQMLEAYPDTLDAFHDFTHYQNCASSFYSTFPSVISTLTHTDDYDNNASFKDFERRAWRGEQAEAFYSMLKDRNYVRSVYNDERFIAYSLDLVEDKIDNAVALDDVTRLNVFNMYQKIGYLTLFRYFPLGLKAAYWASLDAYDDILVGNDAERWSCSPTYFYQALNDNGFTLCDENRFTVFHFDGAHFPYRNDADCMPVEPNSVSEVEQERGHFVMLKEYIQLMQDLDIYDDATIVILSDHGRTVDLDAYGMHASTLLVKLPHEKHAKMPVNNAPVTQMELLPTLAEAVGGADGAAFGDTLSSIPNGPRMRTMKFFDSLGHSVTQRYDSFGVIHFDGDVNEIGSLYPPDEHEPLYDCFY